MAKALTGNSKQKAEVAAMACGINILRRIDPNSTGWDDKVGVALELSGSALSALATGGKASDHFRNAGNQLIGLADKWTREQSSRPATSERAPAIHVAGRASFPPALAPPALARSRCACLLFFPGRGA